MKERKLEEVRKDIYHFLADKGFDLSGPRHKQLKALILEHQDKRLENHLAKIEEVKGNIIKFIEKANLMNGNARAQAQKEGLEICLKWLS